MKNKYRKKCDEQELSNFYKVYCPYCGHTNRFAVRKSHICSYCKRRVYPNKEVEFLEKLEIATRKARANDRARV